MLANMMYFNSLSHILLNKLSLNSGGRNSYSAWAKIYDLIPRSLKSHKFGENYQESDFHAGNGRHLEKMDAMTFWNIVVHKSNKQFSPICFCTFVNNRNQKIGHEPH